MYVGTAGVLLLSGVGWLTTKHELVQLTVLWGLLPSALIMFSLGLLMHATGRRHPEDEQKLARDRATELLEKLAQTPVGGQLTDPSKKVVRVSGLIDDNNHPELHVHEPMLELLHQSAPACLLPRRYGDADKPILDWHKYDLCVIAAEEDVDSATKIKDALLKKNNNLRIYVEAVERAAIGERQESFIKRMYFGGSLKCLVLFSIHMVNNPRCKQELQFAMQRGQIAGDVCENYLIPVAMDRFGLDFMHEDAYLREYAKHLELIPDRVARLTAIVTQLLKLLRQSIFYVPTTPPSLIKKPPDRRFAVALSYPGEHRKFVESTAEELRERLNDELVFYDRYYPEELAVIDLDIHLQKVYSEQSELVVVFLCTEYEQKKWCGLEWRSIRELIMNGRGNTVMLIRFDDSSISGLHSIHGYIDAEDLSPEEVADKIVRRLSLNRQAEDSQ
jgi:hypothetical protein